MPQSIVPTILTAIAAKAISWWAEVRRKKARTPAARAFATEKGTATEARLITRVKRSPLTAKHANACITAIISVMRRAWISEAATPAIAKKRNAIRSVWKNEVLLTA